MKADFVALDVETANPDLSSICQIGIVRVENGSVVDSWTTLVDPETYFDPMNVAIHGITDEIVRGQPPFPEVASRLRSFVGPNVVASHTAFDRVAMERVHERYRLTNPGWTWLDTCRVSRRAWTELLGRGYGLVNLAAHCGIEFRHHDAGEDAKAAALILVHAIRDSGLDIDHWLSRVRQPIDPQRSHLSMEGDADGPLAGNVLVFTGALSMPRADAAVRAAAAGCDVSASVTTKTTMLIVGQQDLERLGGYAKSSKQRKAEELIRQGHRILILSEADFLHLTE